YVGGGTLLEWWPLSGGPLGYLLQGADIARSHLTGIVIVRTGAGGSCCGDGFVNPFLGEGCGDGGGVPGDGCDATCQIEPPATSSEVGGQTFGGTNATSPGSTSACGGQIYWADANLGVIEQADACGANRTTLWGGPLHSAPTCNRVDHQQPSALVV